MNELELTKEYLFEFCECNNIQLQSKSTGGCWELQAKFKDGKILRYRWISEPKRPEKTANRFRDFLTTLEAHAETYKS